MESVRPQLRTLMLLLLSLLLFVACEGEWESEPEPVEYGEETQELITIIIGGGTSPIGGVPDQRIGEVQTLLDAGADPNARQDFFSRRDGWPRLVLKNAPLVALASRVRQPLTIQALLDAGAEVNARDESGATALHYAMYQADHNDPAVTEVLELLLENGADPNIATYDDGESEMSGGLFPLYGAAHALSTDWVRLLIDYGADANARLADNDTIERANAETALYGAISGASIQTEDSMRVYGTMTVSILLKAGTDPNLRRAAKDINSLSDGATTLFQAAIFDLPEIVDLLLEYGADPKVPLVVDPNRPRLHMGSTAIHAARSGRVAEMLINAGAAVDAERKDGTRARPINIAAAGGFIDVINVLLQHGADINYAAERGTPVDYAIHYRKLDTVEFLRSRGGLSQEELGESE